MVHRNRSESRLLHRATATVLCCYQWSRVRDGTPTISTASTPSRQRRSPPASRSHRTPVPRAPCLFAVAPHASLCVCTRSRCVASRLHFTSVSIGKCCCLCEDRVWCRSDNKTLSPAHASLPPLSVVFSLDVFNCCIVVPGDYSGSQSTLLI